MQIEVEWPMGEILEPEVHLEVSFGEFDEVQVEVDLAHAYAFYDRSDPDPREILLPAQRRSLEELQAAWADVRGVLASQFPASLRQKLRWTGLRLTTSAKAGRVYIALSGDVDSSEETEYEEHGIGAVLLGAEVLEAGDPDGHYPRSAPSRIEPRRHPSYHPLELAEIRQRVAVGDWEGLRQRLQDPTSKSASMVDHVLLERVLAGTAAQARQLLPVVRSLMWAREPLPTRLLRADPEVLRELIGAGRFQLPSEIPPDETDPARIAAWVALGVRPRAEPPPPPPKPPLSDGQTLARWLERGWLELAPNASQTLVSAALDRLVVAYDQPDELIATLLKVPGVDEVYVSDEELRELLAGS